MEYSFDDDGGRIPPILRIKDGGNEIIRFTLQDYPSENHKWLAELLCRQLEEFKTHLVRETMRRIQSNIKNALGL